MQKKLIDASTKKVMLDFKVKNGKRVVTVKGVDAFVQGKDDLGDFTKEFSHLSLA